ncbi:transposase [Geminisphaera colitermitum]|uniref:transposase n=1 Tax=Geminisphaera colitermitum TaxID=1148786 RepID=UPI000158D47F|nr:transposase [Geminisphaera colitermitum]
MAKFINIDRDTEMLLPPNLREWVPADHLVHFVMDAMELIDVSEASVNERGTGSAQYPPRLLLGLLVYSYATGMFSSRQIERATYENVAVRLLCADTHPDHDTLCVFRRKNGALLHRAFAQVLELAAGCGILKVGGITVAIDGTKVLANASKHTALSHGHVEKTLRVIDGEIAQLLAKAEQADATPLQDGLTIEGEVARRQERKAKLLQAKAEMEARAYARFQAGQADYEAKQARRAAQAAKGKPPKGRPPKQPDPAPRAEDQVNLTDADSRIMPTQGGFQQAFNAQAGADVASRLIVGKRVSQATNDKLELVADLAEVRRHVDPGVVLVDSGFAGEAAVTAVEVDEQGRRTALTVHCAMQREPHGRTVAQLEKRDDPPEPGPQAGFAERMRHRTATAAGRALYKLRQQTIEPIFGIIKQAMGLRRFSLRGQAKVSLEWDLVCLAYNLKRLHRLRANLRPV